jgi:hypothetical protein
VGVDPGLQRVIDAQDAGEARVGPGDWQEGVGSGRRDAYPQVVDGLYRTGERHGDLDWPVAVPGHVAVEVHQHGAVGRQSGSPQLSPDALL